MALSRRPQSPIILPATNHARPKSPPKTAPRHRHSQASAAPGSLIRPIQAGREMPRSSRPRLIWRAPKQRTLDQTRRLEVNSSSSEITDRDKQWWRVSRARSAADPAGGQRPQSRRLRRGCERRRRIVPVRGFFRSSRSPPKRGLLRRGNRYAAEPPRMIRVDSNSDCAGAAGHRAVPERGLKRITNVAGS